jgi:putative endopeptidase
MPTPRPLALALIIALAAGMAAPEGHAAKKPAKQAKAPAVSAACTDFYANANAEWLNANPMPASGAISAGRGDAIAAGQRPATARRFLGERPG